MQERDPWDIVSTTGEHILDDDRRRLEGWILAGALSFGLWVVLALLGFLARSVLSP